jgi:NodT family efflux transporter outer membrane factor (OMF) lipoprotein
MRPLLLFSMCTVIAGCSVGPSYRPPDVPIAPSFRSTGGTQPIEGQWWRSFNDETLNQLQEQALSNNLTIEQALARVDQSRAAIGLQRAGTRPIGQAEGSVARVRQSTNTGFGLLSRILPDYPQTITNASTGIGASWDIDFAGGNRRRSEIAKAGFDEAIAGLAAARLSVAADLADAYFARGAARLRERQYRALVALARQQHEITAGRVRLGAASVQSLQGAEASLAELESALPLLVADADKQEFRLLVLLGRPASTRLTELDDVGPLPEAPNPIIGLPADLVSRRPDIAAAEYRLIAANAAIGVAMAEYYPKISLSALLGLQSSQLNNLTSPSSLAALGGVGLRWRLFDFGRIDAEIAIARGKTREALAAYRQSVLNATEDVESCFTQFGGAQIQLVQLKSARAYLQKDLQIETKAYQHGGRSKESVLGRERGLAEADLRVTAANENAIRAVVACYRSLGIMP